MTEKYNADLANGLGNLVSRVMKLTEKLGNSQQQTTNNQQELSEVLEKLVEEYRFADALQYIWEKVSEANKYIDAMKPWELVQTDPVQFGVVMEKLLVDIMLIASYLTPFLPETARKIEQAVASGTVEPLFQRIK